MHIGLDLDNTIVCYDRVFVRAAKEQKLLPQDWCGGKKALRDLLRTREGGEEVWQVLQGQAYGSLMHHAGLKPGVNQFLFRCKASGVRVSVVSHKTEYSTKDPQKIPLRKVAMEWMKNIGFFDPDIFGISPKAVYFESSRYEKVQRISDLGCTHFIDDLQEVFDEPGFPSEVEKILYQSNGVLARAPQDIRTAFDWGSIGSLILGPESRHDLVVMARGLMPSLNISQCRRVFGGGNSTVYQVNRPNNKPLFMKCYPAPTDDYRDRLSAETSACRFLHSMECDRVVNVIGVNEAQQVATFEWIEGDRIEKPHPSDLTELVEFVDEVDSLRHAPKARLIAPASGACFSGLEIFRQIRFRRDRLDSLAIESARLVSYLRKEFDTLFLQACEWAHTYWPGESAFDDELPMEGRTLSASDFGFHNVLREKSGKLRVVDLEYFGWDDPTKLTSDFLWHPAMDLDQQMRADWIKEMNKIFSRDKLFAPRLRAVHPLYGLRWAMIVLNPFLRSQHVSPASAEFLCERLEKSRSFCQHVTCWMKNE